MSEKKNHKRAAIASLTVMRLDADGARAKVSRSVPAEVPLALTYNGVPFSVMMVTPEDLEDYAGDITLAREDVGRHNALDKLVGAMAGSGLKSETGFLLLTSRASYELVQKAITAGFSLMVTISAPTTLPISLAEDYGLTLVALACSDSVLIFNDPGKLFQ